MRVVVAEPFSETGLAVLREHGVDVVECHNASRETLRKALAGADGLIVRSQTIVDRELLAAAPQLAVVARAGAGVDTIDVAAATEAGIVVLNTPGANTLAAVELTFGLMLAAFRNIPAAAQETRAGTWERKRFEGRELAGKTLGLVGLGRIGSAVAARAKAFEMRVVAHDPFFAPGRAEALDLKLVGLHELLQRADVVSLHVPLTTQTAGLLDAARLALMKPTAWLVNASRGGIVDENALLQALDDGTIAGAALDVLSEEPPRDASSASRLVRHPKTLVTPHLGGSTVEAQERIATELAREMVAVLEGGPAAGAVNAPSGGAGSEDLKPFVEVAHLLGRAYPQLVAGGSFANFALVTQGAIAAFDPAPLVASFLTGLLQATTDRRVSIVNALAIAEELGIAVNAFGEPRHGMLASSVRVTCGGRSLGGTVGRAGEARLSEVDGLAVDAILEGTLIFTRHHDVPGVIGRVGTILGEADVNISGMQVSRADEGGDAAMILSIDRPADGATLDRLRGLKGLHDVRVVTI